MGHRQAYMMASLIALAGTIPEMRPLASVQCDRCGLCLPGIDAEAGHTRCRECRAPTQTAPPGPVVVVTHSDGGRFIPDPPSAAGYGVIGVDHGAGPDEVAWTLLYNMGATAGVVHIAPIEVACPTCKAAPGEDCNRRTMGRRWVYHRSRVDAAGGGR